MRVTLQVKSGPAAGRKLLLRSGQVAQFGRTDWADFSFPEDTSMADVHFALQIGSGGCNLRQVGPTQVFLNGEHVQEAVVYNHDQIQAGRTVFAVDIDGEGVAVDRPQEEETVELKPLEEETGAGPEVPENTVELAKYLELDDDAQDLAAEEMPPEVYLDELVKAENFRAAIRLEAHLLSQQSKQHAVWWAWICVDDLKAANGNAADQEALEAARLWIQDPSEENRRRAEKAAAATEYQTPAGWVAMSAFWSGDNISAPDLPDVPPDQRLTGQGVTGCLMLAAAHDTPPSLNQRFNDLLVKGRGVGNGDIKLPGA